MQPDRQKTWLTQRVKDRRETEGQEGDMRQEDRRTGGHVIPGEAGSQRDPTLRTDQELGSVGAGATDYVTFRTLPDLGGTGGPVLYES